MKYIKKYIPILFFLILLLPGCTVNKDIRKDSDEMTKNYVSRLPDSVTPVFLFKDYDTYKNFSVNTIGLESDDLSPFGFYKISNNVIVIRYISWKGSTS